MAFTAICGAQIKGRKPVSQGAVFSIECDPWAKFSADSNIFRLGAEGSLTPPGPAGPREGRPSMFSQLR